MNNIFKYTFRGFCEIRGMSPQDARLPGHGEGVFMHGYVKAVAVVLGLLGVWLALLPLMAS